MSEQERGRVERLLQERNELAAEVRELRAQVAAMCSSEGRAPYGYAVEDGRLVPVESEQMVLEAARQAMVDGVSLEDVAKVLAHRGFKVRR